MKKIDPKEFGPLLGGTARAWRLKLDQRLKPMGLSQARWRTLLHLAHAPEPLTQSQIAERLGVEEPTLVPLLHRLEKEGWIVRRISLRDRRCKTVHLGQRARRVIGRMNATAARLRRELIKNISAREMQTCLRVLDQVRQQIERAPGVDGNGIIARKEKTK